MVGEPQDLLVRNRVGMTHLEGGVMSGYAQMVDGGWAGGRLIGERNGLHILRETVLETLPNGKEGKLTFWALTYNTIKLAMVIAMRLKHSTLCHSVSKFGC